MRRKDIVSGVFLLGIGLFITINAFCLDVGSFRDPGPGLIPMLPGIVLTILAAALVLKSYRAPLPSGPSDDSGTQGADPRFKCPPVVIVTLAAMMLFAIALPYLGFIVTSAILMIFLFKFIGKTPWGRSIFGSACSVALCHLIFKVWLSVQFPVGPWGF